MLYWQGTTQRWPKVVAGNGPLLWVFSSLMGRLKAFFTMQTIQLQLIWLLFTFFFLLLSSKRMTVNEISSNYSSVWNLTQILDQFTWWNMSEICPAAEAPTIAGSLQSVNCSIYTALVSKGEKPVMWWAKWVQLVNLHSCGCWWLHKLCVRPGGSVIQRASQQQNLLKNCVKTKKISIWSTLWDVLEKQLYASPTSQLKLRSTLNCYLKKTRHI